MDTSDAKKAKISDENRQESQALAEIWARTQAARDAANVGSQEAFGAEFGIGNQAAVGHFLRGRSAISLKAAEAFARGLGCTVDDFSPRLAAEIRRLAAVVRTSSNVESAPGTQGPSPSIAEALDVICETLTSLTGMRLSVARAVLHEVVDHPEMRDDAAQQLERQLADEAQRRETARVTPQAAQVYRLPSRRPRTTPPKVGGPSIWVEALDRSWGLWR